MMLCSKGHKELCLYYPSKRQMRERACLVSANTYIGKIHVEMHNKIA